MSDIQIQVFNSNGKEYCAVSGIPEDLAGGPEIRSTNALCFEVYTGPSRTRAYTDFTTLPSGSWSILGRLNELSEEQRFTISRHKKWSDFVGYMYAYHHILAMHNPLILIKK